MRNFKDTLETLPNTDHIKEIKLFDSDGYEFGNIKNQPGAKGSIKLYNYLFIIFGKLDHQAAKKGLDLYCEHVVEAQDNPGKHPNIDRLINIHKTKKTYVIEII